MGGGSNSEKPEGSRSRFEKLTGNTVDLALANNIQHDVKRETSMINTADPEFYGNNRDQQGGLRSITSKRVDGLHGGSPDSMIRIGTPDASKQGLLFMPEFSSELWLLEPGPQTWVAVRRSNNELINGMRNSQDIFNGPFAILKVEGDASYVTFSGLGEVEYVSLP